MKKSHLRKIIREEIRMVLKEEAPPFEKWFKTGKKVPPNRHPQPDNLEGVDHVYVFMNDAWIEYRKDTGMYHTFADNADFADKSLKKAAKWLYDNFVVYSM